MLLKCMSDQASTGNLDPREPLLPQLIPERGSNMQVNNLFLRILYCTLLIYVSVLFFQTGTCILSDIKERNRKKTWAFLKDRRDDRLAYVKLYKKFKAGTPAMLAEESISIKAYERKLSYEDIRFYRSIASSQLKKEKAAVLKAASVTAATSASTSPSKSTASLSSAGGGGAGDTSPSKSSSALTVSSSNEVTAAAAASWSSWGTGWLWSAQPTDAQKVKK